MCIKNENKKISTIFRNMDTVRGITVKSADILDLLCVVFTVGLPNFYNVYTQIKTHES